MAYEVVLDNFSGPLDLLLHLVQKQEVNIHDISISVITEQYLAYLRVMEELSLEVASEFVVMAATLLAIKSRMLLPRPPKGGDEEGDELDPREELINQLIEYQRCKWAAEQLKQRQLLQSLVFSREPMDLEPYAPSGPPPLTGVTLWDLVDAFRTLQARLPQSEPVATIQGHVISVEEMMDEMLEKLQRLRRCPFSVLARSMRSRHEVVTGFLALLELVKAQRVVCSQAEPFAEIEIILYEEMTACSYR